MTYDPKCYYLAEVWLNGTGDTHSETVVRLAQRIQDCIEDFMADLENEDRAREQP